MNRYVGFLTCIYLMVDLDLGQFIYLFASLENIRRNPLAEYEKEYYQNAILGCTSRRH